MSEERPAAGVRTDFQGHMLDVMRNLVVKENSATALVFSLSDGYRGERVLNEYAEKWQVREWTPLLLARALADFKTGLGGSASVSAVGPGFIEISQSKCEFGEPKSNRYSGNLCDVCTSVISSVARASGIADQDKPTETEAAIAQGLRNCRFLIPLHQ